MAGIEREPRFEINDASQDPTVMVQRGYTPWRLVLGVERYGKIHPNEFLTVWVGKEFDVMELGKGEVLAERLTKDALEKGLLPDGGLYHFGTAAKLAFRAE